MDAAWSDPLDILEVKGAVLTLGNPTRRKVITIHSDKTVLLTPGLRPEHAQIARQTNLVEANAVEEQDFEDANGLDAIDPVGTVASRAGALDFLKRPRAAGKRVLTIKNFSSNLCFVVMRSNQESTTSTAPRFDVSLHRSTPPASVTKIQEQEMESKNVSTLTTAATPSSVAAPILSAVDDATSFAVNRLRTRRATGTSSPERLDIVLSETERAQSMSPRRELLACVV